MLRLLVLLNLSSLPVESPQDWQTHAAKLQPTRLSKGSSKLWTASTNTTAGPRMKGAAGRVEPSLQRHTELG